MFIAELCSRSLEGGSANPRSNDESLTEARTILPVLVSISTAHVTIQLDLNFGNDTVLPVESVSCWEGSSRGPLIQLQWFQWSIAVLFLRHTQEK